MRHEGWTTCMEETPGNLGWFRMKYVCANLHREMEIWNYQLFWKVSVRESVEVQYYDSDSDLIN